MKEIYFSERQYFRQLWIWIPLLLINSLMLYITWKNMYGISEDPQHWDETPIAIGITGMLLVNAIFLFSHLDTRIDNTGIHYRFFPFMPFIRTKKWEDIAEVYVRKYNPILEYGGWGIRFGIFGKGMALNISGNIGLQIVMKNGKRLLIGTKKGDEMKETIVNRQ